MASSIRVKTLPAMLQRLAQDPAGLSAIASLAIHLPLLLFLPRLFTGTPGLEDEPELRSSVDVVELTPAEQARVPDFQTPEIILPPLAQTPSALSITPLPKFPATQSEPTLPPLQAPSVSPFSWGLGPSFPAPPTGVTTLPRFTVPQSSVVIPVPPRVPPQPTQPAQPPQPPPSPVASPSSSPTTPASPSASPSPTASPEPVAASPSPTPRTEEQVNQDLLARNQELRNKLTYNATGTSSDDFSQEEEWAKSVGQAWLGGDRDITGSIQQGEMNGSYPDVAGYRNLDGVVYVAVLVDETGKPAPNPTILQSSGYGIFDEIALEDALTYKFEPTGRKEVYWLKINYAPNREA